MYVIIGSTTYDKIKKLSFAPETSITSDTVPINQFEVDIITDDMNINAGKEISLYDDSDALWAKYWITFAERIDAYIVRVKAESKLAILERKTMEGKMYASYPVSDLIDDIFSDFASTEYYLDSSFANETITGYMGHHSKKYRLQLVCFVIGAYVKTYFNGRIEILPLDDSTETLIPQNKTFWKPSISYKDWVTSIKVRSYSYVAGTPSTTDEWVEADGVTYVQTSQEVSLSNPDVPVTAPPNIISIDDVTIVNSSNVSAILSRLSTNYFNRMETDLSVINNGEYVPGDKVICYGSDDTLVAGYIASADFTFGLQAKSKIKLVPAEIKESANLEIRYMWDDFILRIAVFLLPVGYNYSVENPYIDLYLNNHRYIFRPLDEYATGTVVSGGVVDEEDCDVALDYYQGTVFVISVDEVTSSDNIVDIA
jgi:hypothetical protein